VQPLNLPEGDHNPNNYSAAEILAAIQGSTGSRKFSFRYELLNEFNRKTADLTNVKACKISQNWLADIKRTASFDLRTGETDRIDYLKDRIKPWVRLHMPPKENEESGPELPPDPQDPPAFEGLTDDFETQEMADVWDRYSEGVKNVGGRLRIPTKTSFPAAVSNRSWSLTGSYVAAEVNSVPSISGGTDVALSMVINSNTAGTNLTIQYRLIGFGSENKLEFINFDNVFQDPGFTSIDYDPDEHVWWRIREDSGTMFWETSRTGLPGTWTIQRQDDTPDWVVDEDETLELFFQCNGDASEDDFAEVDNVNLTPEGVEVSFDDQITWQNNFNGTPGVTGEEVTVNNSARHGNALDEVLGTVVYDDEVSADNSRSARLGEDSTDEGTIVIRLKSALPEWSLRCYFQIPSGGLLNIQPDAVDPDSDNYISLDDDSGTWTAGSVNLTEEVTGNLIDQPVKLEVLNTEDLTIYRFFWTDITSSSPDYVTSESNAGRDPLQSLTFTGGSSTTPAVFVDNVLIAEPETFERFTPDSVNYVEWPQGVFILSSPSQESDQSDVITRGVEGYDLTQVLHDNLVSDRFSSSGLLTVDDNFAREESGDWGESDDGTTWAHNTVADTELGVSADGYAFVVLEANPSTIRLNQAGTTSQEILVDSEVYTRISVDQTATGNSFLPAVVFRLFSVSAYYRLRVHHLTGGTINLSVTRVGTQFGDTVVTSVTYTPGEFLNVRAQCIGHVIRGKVWADGEVEPTSWMIEEEITSDLIDFGFTGLSASAFGDNTNTDPEFRYDLFQLNGNPKNLYTELIHRLFHENSLSHRITLSDEVIPTIREWEAGTSHLTIINDLLDAINYESLSFDENGFAVVKPYVSPQDRGSEFTYQDNDLSIMYPEVMKELDLFSIPNRWILTVSDPDREAITVVLENNDPASPTSTVRRGRTITRFEQEQEASSEATLVEKASRMAFEASQVYEAIEFDTGLNPIHSGNDVYKIHYDPLGVRGKYQEHTWEMDLKAGAKMSHRARRVISLVAGQDPSIITDDLEVTGALQAGNIASGVETVNPVANTRTSHAITGLDLQGRGPVRVFVTAESIVPGSVFMEVTTADHTPRGFTIWVYRTTSTATNIHWLAMRGA
jgi:hypothetical protein